MNQQEKRLINVVLELFSEQGAKFKMEDVASKMKISKKTIYKEYGNKEDLIMMIVNSIFEDIESQLKEVMESSNYDVVEKLIHLSCTFPDAKKVDYHKAMMLRDDFPKPYNMFIHYIEDNWNLSKQLFEQLKDDGRIVDMDHEIFRIIILGITKQVLDMNDDNQEEILEKCVRHVFDGILVK